MDIEFVRATELNKAIKNCIMKKLEGKTVTTSKLKFGKNDYS